jgi:hypothetical protein
VLSPNAVLEELLAMSTIMLWPRGILLVGIREGQYSHSRVENTFQGGGGWVNEVIEIIWEKGSEI